MQLGEQINITNKNLVEKLKFMLKVEIGAWKTVSYKERLQTMKNLSVFSLKLFFFI